jgi:hypothetical protein
MAREKPKGRPGEKATSQESIPITRITASAATATEAGA